MKVNRLTRDGRVSQAYQILRAIDAGCRSSLEISDETELPVHSVSAYLSRLCAGGYIRKTGEADRVLGTRGMTGHTYEITCGRRAIQENR